MTLPLNLPARLKPLPALCLAALLAACSSAPPAAPAAPPAPPATAAQLQAYDWDLARAFDGRGQPVATWALPSRPAPRLSFQGDRVTVQNLCNVVGAGVTLDGPRMQLSRAISTQRACPEPGLMQLEQRVGAQLPQTQRFELRPGAAGAAPTLVLHFADGSRWELAGAPTAATRYGSAGERVFLEVAPQLVPCNHPQMANARCMRVRELRFNEQGLRQGAGEWRIFQGDIEGFRFEPGVRKVLRLQRYSMARGGQVPAGGPTHAYVLDMVVEQERVR